MDVRQLKKIGNLTELLESDERNAPGMVLIGSATCPLSLDLQATIRQKAPELPQFVFYELNIDDYSDPDDDLTLTRLLSEWHADTLPAQILLPSKNRPSVINAVSLAGIKKALHLLY